jgi:hypothetical protein
MAAGVLAKSGYFMGERMSDQRDRARNPKGSFEDLQVNMINEDLLSRVVPQRPPLFGRWFFRDRPRSPQRWLARVPVGTQISPTSEIQRRIEALTRRKPFCFKDPRFCYTLSAWRPYLEDTAFVCVFREPAATVNSILKLCPPYSQNPDLSDFSITQDQAMEVWILMYRFILEVHRHDGDWLFIHCNQVLENEGLDRLSAHLDAPIDKAFPERSLLHSKADLPTPKQALEVYQELCTLAQYENR